MQFGMTQGYKHPGLGDDNELVDHYAAAKMAIAKWTGEFLMRHYPGHAWFVEVLITSHSGRRATGGIIKIRLNHIMPPNRWYVIQLADTLNDTRGRTIMHAAGELLERYGLHRGAFDLDDWRRAMNSMPVSVRIRGKGYDAPLQA